jgi:lipoprotein NlpI
MLLGYVSLRRTGKDTVAELEGNASRLTTKDWPFPVIEYFVGQCSKDKLLAAAAGADERCEAQFYIGDQQLALGNRDEAKIDLQTAAESCPHTFMEYNGAIAELERLHE